jgi:hypothetical protein
MHADLKRDIVHVPSESASFKLRSQSENRIKY